ncbi:MAG: tRNA (cytidine(56)-2'-O)-methyltransferase [Methanobacteriota archaeon]|nr:MAG: tRNA (cytidine(56)-2'-O)-methyltransferase [Euryarchaeota archaeon]
MMNNRKIGILRLDHRVFRDQRITTHVGLTARAFGCTSFAYTGEKDENLEESLTKVAKRWGGELVVSFEQSAVKYINSWNGLVVHLTMYGEHHKETIETLHEYSNEDILLVVGGAKVPPKIYELADFNTAIGLQPHSEIAAIGIFLTDFLGSDILYRKIPGAEISLDLGTKGTRKDGFKKGQNVGKKYQEGLQ